MARSKAFSPSPPRSPAEDPQALVGERSQTDGSSRNAGDPLSADDIDEQIRAYFAQDLE